MRSSSPASPGRPVIHSLKNHEKGLTSNTVALPRAGEGAGGAGGAAAPAGSAAAAKPTTAAAPPIARALLKAREGDEVKLQTPGGSETLDVLAVRYPAPVRKT